MKKVHRSKTLSNLPLFAWADSSPRPQYRPLAYPARWVRKHRPGISPALASVIAELAFAKNGRS